MKKVRALAKSAGDHAKHAAAAEASVVRWEWATRPRVRPEPAYFETMRLSAGKRLAREPAQWKIGQAHEGFDREDRIVIIRERAAIAGEIYETFYRYERGGIARLHYAPHGVWIEAAWLTVERGRVIAIDSISQLGATTRTYTYDDRGRVASCSHASAALEYEYRGDKIVRTRLHTLDGARVLYWQR